MIEVACRACERLPGIERPANVSKHATCDGRFKKLGVSMKLESILSAQQLEVLRKYDSCTVSNAVERFNLRLRNTGFTNASIRCMFQDAPPMVGYAATACLRSGEPPISGRRFHDRTDWWNSILEIPSPRIVVLDDMDQPPGVGAFLGDVHAAILKALGCVGVVTNGAVRELPRVRQIGLQLFAGSVAVSHAYAHIFDLGAVVQVGGMEVKPGDLLHGDQHGVLNVPKEIAPELPATADKLLENERRAVEFCSSNQFSVHQLRELINGLG